MHKDIPTLELCKKSFKRLLLPFFVFILIGLLLDAIIKFTKEPGLLFLTFAKGEMVTILTTSIIWPTAASWFLLSLFVARISFNVLHQKVHALLLVVFFACAAYAIHLFNCRAWGIDIHISSLNTHILFPTFYVGNMCHGISLYSLGNYLKVKQFNNKIFIIAAFFFILKYFIYAGIDFRANTPSGTNFMLAVVYGMSGCIVVNNIFYKIANIEIPFVSYIGRNSMVYYLVHFPVMFTTTSLFWTPFENKELWVRFVVLSLVVTLFLFLADYIFRVKKIRFLIGG